MAAILIAALVATALVALIDKTGEYDASLLEKAGVWAIVFIVVAAPFI
jgi:hypothetical protein